MNRFQRSLSLFKSSWTVICSDRELLLLPVFSALVSLVVTLSFVVPGLFSMREQTTVSGSSVVPTPLTYVLIVLFYLVSAFVVIFFNSALICGANERLAGGDPTISSAIQGALQRIGLIFQWSLVSATVSMVIRQIQDNGGIVGKIFGGLLGFAWSVVTFLVLPTLVLEGLSVKDAFRRSAESIKTTWGENVIGQGGLGLIGFVGILPFFVVGAVGIATLQTTALLGGTLIAIAMVGMLGVSIVVSALGVVYQTALYRFATHQTVPAFDDQVLAGAFRAKVKR